MQKILLDTNFIISCIKKKIDFFEQLQDFEILIPKQVIGELEKISKKGKIKDREAAKISLHLLSRKKTKQIIKLNTCFVDTGIINYIQDNKIVLATLDRGLRKKIKSRFRGIRVIAIRGRKIIFL